MDRVVKNIRKIYNLDFKSENKKSTHYTVLSKEKSCRNKKFKGEIIQEVISLDNHTENS